MAPRLLLVVAAGRGALVVLVALIRAAGRPLVGAGRPLVGAGRAVVVALVVLVPLITGRSALVVLVTLVVLVALVGSRRRGGRRVGRIAVAGGRRAGDRSCVARAACGSLGAAAVEVTGLVEGRAVVRAA